MPIQKNHAPEASDAGEPRRRHSAGWFILLWASGVGAALLLALPFRLIIAMIGR